MSSSNNNNNNYYQHKYGGIYYLIKKITNKTTDEELVLYKHVHPYPEHEAVRTPEDFFSSHRAITDEEELKKLLARPAEEFQKEITAEKNRQRELLNKQ